MALVLSNYELTVTLVDNGANTTTLRYELRTQDQAVALTSTQTILTQLGLVTDGAIGQYRLSLVAIEDALSLPASGAIQAEVSASMTVFIEDEGLKKANYRIPMPKPAVFVSTIGDGANRVNTSLQAVLDYHALFETGGVANISDGEIAGGLIGGIRVTRANRGG